MPRTNTPDSVLAELSDGFDRFSREQAGRIDDLNAEVDRLNARLAAQAMPGGAWRTASPAVAALGRYGRTGEPQAAMSIGSAPDGGHIVAPELDRAITRRLADVSPMRGLAEVIETTSAVYERVIGSSAPAAEWVDETAARVATATPGLMKAIIPAHELYALAPATATFLEDAEEDVAAFLMAEIADRFAAREGAAFVSGSGVGQPRGFLAYPRSTADDAARTAGSIQTVPSGAAASLTSDGLLGLLYSLRAPYRRNATWVMSSATARLVMGLKDADGRFLWNDSLAAGQPPTLIGRPVAVDENMPPVAAGAAAVAVGDWRRAYLICDRLGTQILRDPFTNRPYVNFYARKRVGGAVTDDDAIKLLVVGVN